MGGKISKRKTNISDEHRSGRPLSVATETVKQQIEQQICHYKQVTIDEIAVVLKRSHGSAYSIVHDDLGYRTVCRRWVPRNLSHDQKCVWQAICTEHLNRHACEDDDLLHQIVTGDESWVYHYEPDSKIQSMQRKHPSSPANKKFRHGLPLGKSC